MITKQLSEPWLSLIISNKKKLEGIINDDNFKYMEVGDMIKWYNEEGGYHFAITKIIRITKYQSFKKLIKHENIDQLFPAKTMDEEGALSIYREQHDKNNELENGVLCLKIKMCIYSVVNTNDEGQVIALIGYATSLKDAYNIIMKEYELEIDTHKWGINIKGKMPEEGYMLMMRNEIYGINCFVCDLSVKSSYTEMEFL